MARKRQGFTLLELILALGLSVVVLGLIGVALNLNLKTLDDRRGVVEEAQLAKAILHLVAKDLRAAVQFGNTSDVVEGIQGVDAAAGAAGAGAGGAGGDPMGGGGDPTGGGAGAGGDMGGDGGDISELTGEAGVTENNTDIANATTVPPELGLYGNQYQLQIDISRPPRIEEYEQIIDPENPYALLDRPSDVKTVAYYMQSDRSNQLTAGAADQDDLQAGLVRRSLDRAITMHAIENGNVESLQDLGEVLAPEVTGIQFAYFDGTEWRTEWDSSAEGTLPVAIEIMVSVRSRKLLNDDNQPFINEADALASDRIYRLIVRMPVARQEGELSEEDAALQELGL